jgi:aldehyde dehydrogenase (NAD+)
MSIHSLMQALHVPRSAFEGGSIATRSPTDGTVIGQVHATDQAAVPEAIARAHAAYLRWRDVPAPQRGELVRLLGNELRENKDALGRLVSLEVGKVSSEG